MPCARGHLSAPSSSAERPGARVVRWPPKTSGRVRCAHRAGEVKSISHFSVTGTCRHERSNSAHASLAITV